MMNKLRLTQRSGRLACNWVQTGDPKMPLACVWADSKAPQIVSAAFSSDEAGRVQLCA
jgi:hypothetical protein